MRRNSEVELFDAIARSSGAGPIDLVVRGNSVVTLNSGSHTLTVHSIGADGSLTSTGSAAVATGVAGGYLR